MQLDSIFGILERGSRIISVETKNILSGVFNGDFPAGPKSNMCLFCVDNMGRLQVNHVFATSGENRIDRSTFVTLDRVETPKSVEIQKFLLILVIGIHPNL